MPSSRHSFGTGAPPSFYLRIESIWLSEKRDFFVQVIPAFSLRKILLLSSLVFRRGLPNILLFEIVTLWLPLFG